MKYYETNFVDYIKKSKEYNLHNDKLDIVKTMPERIEDLGNIIFTGPPGVGKYSQVLKLIEKYSDSNLKYDKKITCYFEKQNYTYRISDIHYEIDMSLLGCNSKQLWHEIFFQIIDIITIKTKKEAIFLCKNFHNINNELLETFYSYMQHQKINQNINIKFFIITEHVSFIPYNIINNSIIVSYKRPKIDKYKKLFTRNNNETESFLKRIIGNFNINEKSKKIIKEVTNDSITNIKELKSFDIVDINEVPTELFDIITSKLINEIINFKSSEFIVIRDQLYDILTYNIDIYECIWHILSYLINNDYLKDGDNEIILNLYIKLKYYNNNYRPIYHLERILYSIIVKIHNI